MLEYAIDGRFNDINYHNKSGVGRGALYTEGLYLSPTPITLLLKMTNC